MSKSKSGFTIVELLIVIVVIAILAAISIVAYNGIQQRARDSQRVQDAKTIQKSLLMYRAEKGELFAHTTSNWEMSAWQPAGQFLSALVTANILQKVPVDPINDGDHLYRYYRYTAGTYGCDTVKGAYIVFQIIELESSSRPYKDSPGFSCSGRDWSGEADYVFGIFENG